MHSSYVKCSWKLEKSLWTTGSDVWGTMHAKCGQKLGVAERRHTFRSAQRSGLTGIHWSFPETLWSVPMGARPRPVCGPLPGGGPCRTGPLPLPGPLGRAWDRVNRRWQWDPLRKATSYQPKHTSLKMLKQLRKRTLCICLTSLG